MSAMNEWQRGAAAAFGDGGAGVESGEDKLKSSVLSREWNVTDESASRG